MGELEVRGPWVASAYYETPEQAERWTDDGWFKTGDIASFHPKRLRDDQGPLEGRDQVRRRVDLVRRPRERAHGAPAIAEAAVIAMPHEKWDERPLAVCVLPRGRRRATPDELREFLAPNFAKWWLPDAYEFVDEIPKTAVGKFRKTALREQFAKASPTPA